jgi:hypothetical protein
MAWIACPNLSIMLNFVNLNWPTIASLPSGHFDDFVTSLHNGVISLVNAPTVTTANALSLLDTDEWFLWFGHALGATILTATASTDGILSFTITIDMTDTNSLIFDTMVTKTVFNLLDLTSLPQNGVVGGLSMIIFGIGPNNPLVQPTLGDMMAFVGLSLGGNPLIHLLDGIAMTIDPAKCQGSRNAISASQSTSFVIWSTVGRITLVIFLVALSYVESGGQH